MLDVCQKENLMSNKKDTVKTGTSLPDIELDSKQIKTAKDLQKTFQPTSKKSREQKQQESTKYLDKKQIDHACTVIKTRLAGLEKAEKQVVEYSISIGEQLVALQHGMKRGEFYPFAEKEFKLQKSTLQLYMQLFNNKELPGVKKATTIREARQAVISSNSSDPEKKEQKEKQKKESVAMFKAGAGQKPLKELSPEDCANQIVSAVQKLLESFDAKSQKLLLSQLVDEFSFLSESA